MKTAIIIYSITGNTRSVAQRLIEAMNDKNLDVSLSEVTALSNKPDQTIVELVHKPDTNGFDRLFFASPVHAFRLSKVMKTYLMGLDDLKGKEINLFITHHFPFAWMGGNSTLKQMRKLIEKKNGSVKNVFSVNWSSKKREDNIEELIRISMS